MKRPKSILFYGILALLGLGLLFAGLFLCRRGEDAEGIRLVLPHLMVGLGAGAFGGSSAMVANGVIARMRPDIIKANQVEESDERNIAITRMAKAKALDLSLILHAVVVLTFTALGADLYVILTLVGLELLVALMQVYYAVKYQKQL